MEKTETLEVRSDLDISRVRQIVRQYCIDLSFSIIEQTKMVTAASELARNIITHGGGEGTVTLQTLEAVGRHGLRVLFEDSGPGISDVNRALQNGYTTAGGLGLGLGGTKRLVSDFEICSKPGEGVKVLITLWK